MQPLRAAHKICGTNERRTSGLARGPKGGREAEIDLVPKPDLRRFGLENARTGVTVNALCPGFVLTPLVQKQIDDIAARDGISGDAARSKLLGEKQPSEQFVTPEQIGKLALFLCSDGADEIRGAAMQIDGGWTAQ
jgi:enoyl-[acyl-carrier-protein] reductase (NADH)